MMKRIKAKLTLQMNQEICKQKITVFFLTENNKVIMG